LTEFQLIPGHKMITEVVEVTRWSAVWNSEYPDTDLYLVCECGERVQIHGDSSKEERLVCIEHSISVLGKPKEPYQESRGESW
jgi:hypothetical protein